MVAGRLGNLRIAPQAGELRSEVRAMRTPPVIPPWGSLPWWKKLRCNVAMHGRIYEDVSVRPVTRQCCDCGTMWEHVKLEPNPNLEGLGVNCEIRVQYHHRVCVGPGRV